MQARHLTRRSGVTLIEVTMAVAIFAVVIALSAQSILSFYVALKVQEDRVVAVHSARTIMNALREKREEYRGANESDMVNWTNYFSWITTENTAKWTTYTAQQTGGAALKNQNVTVTMYKVNADNSTGGAAAAGDNPLEVHVVVTWTDGKGRTMTSRLVTRMTDR